MFIYIYIYIYIYICKEATCKLTMRRYVSTIRKNVKVFRQLATSSYLSSKFMLTGYFVIKV